MKIPFFSSIAHACGASSSSSSSGYSKLDESEKNPLLDEEKTPPDYSKLRPTYEQPDTDDLIARVRATTAARESAMIGQPSDDDVERLRNFLLYTLIIDYEVQVAGVFLSASDCERFLQLEEVIRSLERGWQLVEPSEEERATIGGYLWHEFHAPARALGLPSDLVLMAVHRFSCSRTVMGNYKGCINSIAYAADFHTLASKLYFDRTLVIPHVAPSKEAAAEILRGLQVFQDLYFEDIRGLDSITVDIENWKHWSSVSKPSFQLHQRAQEYQARKERGVLSTSIRLTVLECVAGLEERAKKEKRRREAAGRSIFARVPWVLACISLPERYFGHGGFVNPNMFTKDPMKGKSRL